jgi:hypothetical protein
MLVYGSHNKPLFLTTLMKRRGYFKAQAWAERKRILLLLYQSITVRVLSHSACAGRPYLSSASVGKRLSRRVARQFHRRSKTISLKNKS